jgi:cardiolipin synthase
MSTSTIWTVVSILNYLGVIIAVLHILRHRREPRGMLAWILALLLLPVVGLMLFLLIGNMPVERKVRRRRRRRRLIEPALSQRTRELAAGHDALGAPQHDPQLSSLIRLASRVGETVVTRGNSVAIYHDAEAIFLALSLAIEEAVSHVNLEYYIFAPDETGLAVRDLLIKKARQGVEVRLLLDAVGCLGLPRSFVRPMKEAGVKVAFFLPWGLSSRRLSLNCRNHRKLVVVDGRVGFTGSQNIGDVYLGRKKKYGPWRDTHLRLRGPSVAQLQEIFAEDWHFAAGENLLADPYFPEPVWEGEQSVQIVASGPDRRRSVLHQLLFAALTDARHVVSVLTPYFVPDLPMVLALQSAALRGVHVRLLIPSRNNHRVVIWAGRSCYGDLIDSGVEVYEYEHALLHSKVVVVDDRWAMVGSANMDERSFRLNFEVTSLLYDVGLAQELHADFDALRHRARRITREELAAWGYGEHLLLGLARLATPML